MLLLATGLLAATAAAAHAPDPRLARDPDRAPISVSDVTLFWRAYDAWVAAGADSAKLAAVLKTEYLDKASDGVKDFTPNRIVDAESLAARILDDRGYYERARPYSSQILALEPQIRALYRQFRDWCPEARFPALYFVVGRRNSGGVSSPRAFIIGTAMFGDEKARLRFDVMVPSYGDAHERELWERFTQDLNKPDGHRAWLYNARDEERVGPPGLGYYMGYKITQAFYQASADPAAALRTIIEMHDPEQILKQSRYSARFGDSRKCQSSPISKRPPSTSTTFPAPSASTRK